MTDENVHELFPRREPVDFHDLGSETQWMVIDELQALGREDRKPKIVDEDYLKAEVAFRERKERAVQRFRQALAQGHDLTDKEE